MCGLVGVLQYQSEVPRELRNKALRILFSELMLKTESRGKDATGLYQMMANGDWMMTKKGQKVTDWMNMDHADAKCEDPVVYNDVMDSWSEHPEELRAIIGHCRAKTVGNNDNENNHPFAIQLDEQHALLGVHNGTIYNHEVIFDRLPGVIERQGRVDSEAIFHLLYHLTEHGTVPMSGDIIKELGKRVDGAYACIVTNSKFPNQVSVFREGRPMEFFMVSPLNILIIASEKKIIDSALEKYEFIRRFVDSELPKLDTEDRMLPDKDYKIFDLSTEFPKGPLVYNDFTKLETEKGATRKYNDDVDEDWKDPKNVRPKTTTGSSGYQHTRHVASGAKSTTTPMTPAAKTTKVITPGSKPEERDEGITVDAEVVEVEIGSEADAKRIYEKIKVLGLSPNYDKVGDVAKSIGVGEARVRGMTPVELANAVGKAHFNIGCAAARLESQEQYLDVREKAKEILRKLDKAESKQLKAQRRIWEFKTVVQILLALYASNCALNTENVGRVLKAFPKLESERRADVLKAAEGILEAGDTEDLVKMVLEWVAKSQKKKREEKTASS